MKCDEILTGWLSRAEKESDPYYKFISAYIALNFLYQEIRVPGDCECDAMLKLLQEKSRLKGWEMNSSDVSEYLREPIQDMKNPSRFMAVNVDDECTLFKAIYQVRCNLFHGNKELDSKRNILLAEQGAAVILSLLK